MGREEYGDMDRYGGGSIMIWTCMAAKGTDRLLFIDDATADRSFRRYAGQHYILRY